MFIDRVAGEIYKEVEGRAEAYNACLAAARAIEQDRD